MIIYNVPFIGSKSAEVNKMPVHMMKAMLVPIENHDRTRSILSTALAFARNFDSQICGFALSPATTPFLAADVIGASVIYEPLADYNEESATQARGLFESFMKEQAIPRRTSEASGVTWSWKNDVPPGDHMVGILGRVFDVTVVGRSEPRVSGPRSTTLDAALFDSGRPILIAPPTAPESIGRRILIAWNRSTETARTVAVAMPLLKQADEIVVLAVEGSHVPGPMAEELISYLRTHGISARSLSIAPGKRGAGATILEEAAALGSDLVVKGAFTQSRLRQIIFGGATQHLLTETEVPVFMAH
ncbi:MAG TPA: universal stress protein [Pararhizobium sp.]|nr:universal stress protein [Pararhizobium sp.]